MSSQNMNDVAVGAIKRVLEEAAFLFPEEVDKESRPAADTWSPEGVSLDFTGIKSGNLHMWAAEGFCRSAAANMLGLDEDDPDAARKGMDALKELLNMIVGNFLTDFYGQEPIFDLGLPRQLAADALPGEYQSPHAIWLSSEGEPVLFTMQVPE